MNNQVQQFIRNYQLYENDLNQQIQLQHRYELAKTFGIRQGMRILEVGCGQGDTTVVLADLVGEEGSIVAIDIAKGSYGAPITLAQAQAKILASPLGLRISFLLETDFATFEPNETFDAIVFSHCSWYFHNQMQLGHYFTKARKIAPTLFFAEWDMNYTKESQRGHFLAVSLIALYSQFIENDGNIQQVLDRAQIELLLKNAGFTNFVHHTVDATYLQDGTWEKYYANHIYPSFQSAPPLIQSLSATYYNMLLSSTNIESLNSFVIVAR